MTLVEITRFELGYQVRRPATWLYFGLLFVLGVLRAEATDAGVVLFHAPANAAFSTLLVGVLGLLVTAGLFAEAGHRDIRWRTTALVYTSSVRKGEYLAGRFLGALIINALLLFAIPIGLLLGTFLFPVDPDVLGTFRPEAYLSPYVVFLIPNLIVSAAVLFAVTVLTRRSLPAYLAALVMVAAYLFGGLSAVGGGSWMAALLDPTGSAALSAQTELWTRIELNTRLIGLEGVLLWNRLLWTLVSAGIVILIGWRFRFGHTAEMSRRSRRSEIVPSRSGAAQPLLVPNTPRSFGFPARMRQVLTIAGIGLRQIVLSREFFLIAIGIVLFSLLITMQMVMTSTPLWPLTHEVAADLSGWPLRVVIALLTVFFAGELVWKERDVGIEKIGDSVPAPEAVFYAGKLLALCVTLVVLHTVLMGAGMLAQGMQGYYDFKAGLYLQILFGLQLPDYFLFAVLALFVHVLVNQKYAAHLMAVLLFVAFEFSDRIGIDHNLFVYASDPGWVYSELNGFGSSIAPLFWFKGYWAAWALLLGTAALLFWVRGPETSLKTRVCQARRRFTHRMATVAAAGLLLVVCTGGFVFYNANILNDYRTTREEEETFVEYERRYKRFEHIAQPRLTGIRVHAELYPERREASLRGTYILVNRSAEPIDSLHMSMQSVPEVTIGAIQFNRSATPMLKDEALGYSIYAFGDALQPGDSVEMHFELTVARRGFQNREIASHNRPMVGDYTNIGSWLLPVIGYERQAMELSNPRTRREHGLPPSDIRPSVHDERARQLPRLAPWSDWIDLEATVGTSGDQIAVLPGTLQRSWTEGDRRYFQYRTDTPILNFFSLLSAEFAVREAKWRDVDIRVLHHPEHAFNVEHIIRHVQASLQYYSEQFGPYPYHQLSMVEFPRYGSGARAYAGQIIYSERHPITLARLDSGPATRIRRPLQVTAHEVAHQWWGQQVMGADVEGSYMLSETLAQYSSAMVLKRTHGDGLVREFLRDMQERYLRGRGRNAVPEVPLLLTTEHSYIFYGKGPVALYALQDYIGEERVNGALRSLVAKFGKQGAPYPTTLDLYEELHAVTPDSLQYLLDDLMATITLWDLQATGARAEPTGTGEYRVTLDVVTKKVRADSVGNESEVPMDDWVDVGIFAAAENGQEFGKPLYVQKHRIRSGEKTVLVTVPGKPARAGIDPYRLLIDRDLNDNAVNIEETQYHQRGGR